MTRLEKLQNIFEQIDEGIGIGPSEQIIDESKVDEYILNFKNKLEKYKIKEHFEVIYEEYGNKSFMEKLDEI